jgi:hypothetical protein
MSKVGTKEAEEPVTPTIEHILPDLQENWFAREIFTPANRCIQNLFVLQTISDRLGNG